MTRFYAETNPDIGQSLSEPTDQLAYFLSFAVAERYGAQHHLAKAANLIKIRHKVDMNPLLNFVDRQVEGPQERRAFEETSWQDPERLAKSIRSTLDAMEADARVSDYLVQYPEVVAKLEELWEVCLAAMEAGAQVRLSFDLEAEGLKTPQVFGGETKSGNGV
jgi:hypothetical protein